MKFTAFAALLPLVAAAPLESRQTQALTQNDIIVLQLAHYLEQLEFALYSGGCDNFTDAQYTAAGLPSGFREGVCLTAQQEGTHRDVLAQILTAGGQTPLPACQYSFPYTTPSNFAALANLVTSTGIGAYLGGADLVMNSAQLLTDAAAILSVEARHDSFLRAGLGGSPFPSPFDTALPGLWAYNVAHMFVVSCPQELPTPPFVLLPKLSLTAPYSNTATPNPAALKMPVPAGTTLALSWDPSKFFVSVDPKAPLYVAFVNQNTPVPFVQVTKTGTGTGTVALPKGINNVAWACLTTFSSGLNATQLAQFGTLAGPTEILID